MFITDFLFVYYCQITPDNVKHDARNLNHNERNPDTLSEPPWSGALIETYNECLLHISFMFFLFVYYCQITSDKVQLDNRTLIYNERNPDTLLEPPSSGASIETYNECLLQISVILGFHLKKCQMKMKICKMKTNDTTTKVETVLECQNLWASNCVEP